MMVMGLKHVIKSPKRHKQKLLYTTHICSAWLDSSLSNLQNSQCFNQRVSLRPAGARATVHRTKIAKKRGHLVHMMLILPSILTCFPEDVGGGEERCAPSATMTAKPISEKVQTCLSGGVGSSKI